MAKVAWLAAQKGWCSSPSGGRHHCLPAERARAQADAERAADVEIPSRDHPEANPAAGYFADLDVPPKWMVCIDIDYHGTYRWTPVNPELPDDNQNVVHVPVDARLYQPCR